LRYAGETLLINPQRWEIVYRGPALDESGAAVHPDLAASLQSLIAGEVPAAQVTQMNTAEPLPEHAVPVDVSYANSLSELSFANSSIRGNILELDAVLIRNCSVKLNAQVSIKHIAWDGSRLWNGPRGTMC
jgi:hypothetical protein